MFVINSWNFGDSVKLLKGTLNAIVLKDHTTRRPQRQDILINWGVNQTNRLDNWYPFVLNTQDRIKVAVNKKRFFEAAHAANVSIPLFFTSKDDAIRWLHEGEGSRTLVCRTIVDGHEGAGIVFATNPLDVPDAPLYTEYVKKKAEYRVHIFRNTVIDFVQKKRKVGFEGDHRVRNTANGYVFARTGVAVPDCALEQSLKAVEALHLDFGAVDIIYNQHYDTAYVLEVNTAPGIEGTTLSRYTEAFQNFRRSILNE